MNIVNRFDIGGLDDLGRMETPAHRLDARAKTVVTLAFIAAVVSFPRYELSALTPFLFYPVALLALGRIPARPILERLLVAAPFAVVVGLFNPLLDRQPVAIGGAWCVAGGWLSFASILMRFILTVGAALVLVACTGLYRLGAGLAQVGVPRVLVVQLLFLYRYLFVVTEAGANMARAVALRSAGRRAPSLRVYGSLIGHLLLRSLDRAERVYRAMAARGFEGDIRLLRRPAWRWTDGVFVCGWLAFFAAARSWNLADGLGRWLTGGAP